MIHCLIFCIVLRLTVLKNKTADWGGWCWWRYYLLSLVCQFVKRCNQGRLRYRQSQPHITQTQRATVDSDIPLADLGPRRLTRSHSIAIILYMLNFQRRTMRYLHIVCFSRGQVVVCDVLRLVLGDGKIVSCIDHRYCWLPFCYYWAEIIKYKTG